MQTFQYTPLAEGEIRLLTFNITDPAPREVDLSISNVHLGHAPDYLALSYTWGDENDRRDIGLNGHVVSVTSNLFDALDSLRKRIAAAVFDFDIRLWVDALCINQNHVPERNSQVTRMRDIYAGASIVWAFVGTEGENDADGFRLMTTLFGPSESFQFNLDSGDSLPMEIREQIEGAICDPDLQLGWRAIGQLLNRPWWTRAWTVQEIVVANSAIFSCGDQSLDFPQVFKFGDILGMYMLGAFRKFAIDKVAELSNHDGLIDGIKHISVLALQNGIQGFNREVEEMGRSALVRLAQDLGVNRAQERAATLEWTELADFYLHEQFQVSGHALADLLTRFSERKCGDPRDKIYAFLGLARPFMERRLIPVDYDLPAPALWRIVIRTHIQLYGNLDVLSLFSGVPIPPSSSSWAHELTPDLGFDPSGLELHREGIKFNTSMDKTPQLGPNADSEEILSLKGIVVDVVEAVGPVYHGFIPSYNSIDDVMREIDQYEDAHTAMEEWAKLAGVKDSFTRLKRVALILLPDQSSDLIVAQSSPRDEEDNLTFRTIWQGLNGSSGRYPTRQANLDAFIQTLMIDPVNCPEYAEIFHTRRDILLRWDRGDPFMPTSSSARLFGLRFYVTAGGYYGLISNEVEAGDKVCILYGARTPYLLRSIDDARHAIMGWTYVHGLMNGEGLAGDGHGDEREQMFRIQ